MTDTEQVLWDATRSYLATLPADVEDAAFRCAIVHWFDADILRNLQGSGSLRLIGRPVHAVNDTEAMYADLQALPFVEEFPERGHNVHELTRRAILDWLWRDEPEFYREVSNRAAGYFSRYFEGETGAERSQLAEYAYHHLISDQADAIEQIDGWMEDLTAAGEGGWCHGLTQIAEEQAAAGRISPAHGPLLKLWRIMSTYAADDYTQVVRLAKDLLADAAVPTAITNRATKYLAESLRLLERSDEAYDVYLTRLNRVDSDVERALTLLGLGRVCRALDRYGEAEEFLGHGLGVYVPVLAGSKELPPLRFREPEAWHRVLVREEESAPQDSSTAEESAAPETVRYYLEVESDEPEHITGDGGREFEAVSIGVSRLLADFWLELGYTEQSRDRYDLAAACGRLAKQIYEDLGANYNALEAVQLLYTLGVSAGDVELMESQIDYQRSLLQSAREQNDTAAQFKALLGLANSHLDRSEYDSARSHFEEALKLARPADDPILLAGALSGMARLDWTAEKYEAAAARLHEALDLYRRANYKEGQAGVFHQLGGLESSRGRPVAAAEYLGEALRLYKECNERSGQADVLRSLGGVAQADQRHAEALRYFEEALALAREIGSRTMELNCLSDLAGVYNSRNDRATAAGLYGQALSLARELRRPSEEAEILLGLGDLHMDLQLPDEAQMEYEAGDAIYSTLQQPENELNALVGLLLVASRRGDTDAHARRADEFLSIAHNFTDPLRRTQALRRLAGTLQSVGDYDRLLGVLEEALALQPDHAATLRLKGDVLSEVGEYSSAAEVLDRAIRAEPENADAFAAKGWALENVVPARADESRAAYETALRLKPGDNWARKGLGNALRLLGDRQGAEAQYRRVILETERRGLSDAANHSLLGWCYYSIGDYPRAIEEMIQVEASESEISVAFDLGLALMCAARHVDALDQYRKALNATSQKHPMPRRGFLFVALEDLKEAAANAPDLNRVPQVAEVLRLLQNALQGAVAESAHQG